MTRRLGKSSFSFILETDIESGTKRREVSIVVFDVLERWLKGDGLWHFLDSRHRREALFLMIFLWIFPSAVHARIATTVVSSATPTRWC